LKQFELIKNYFGFGEIYETPEVGNAKPRYTYGVTALEDCIKIRDHFKVSLTNL